MKFSPDGRWVAASGDGGFVKIWDGATRREEAELQSQDGTVKLWNLPTAQERTIIRGRSFRHAKVGRLLFFQ